MKKILLSSIIMLGVCGAVNAQNATGSKFKKNDQSSTSTSAAVAPTPQKAAIMPASDVVPTPAAETRTAADKQAAATSATAPVRTSKTTQTATATTSVNAAGVTVVSDEVKEKQAKIAAEAKANAAKNQQ